MGRHRPKDRKRKGSSAERVQKWNSEGLKVYWDTKPLRTGFSLEALRGMRAKNGV